MVTGPVLSPVDYAAWEKGYMPPSEHVLIDQLAYRGAKVVLGSDWGDMAVWVVMRGTRPNAAVRKALREMLDLMLNEEEARGPDAHPGISSSAEPTTLPAKRDQQAHEEAVLTSAQEDTSTTIENLEPSR